MEEAGVPHGTQSRKCSWPHRAQNQQLPGQVSLWPQDLPSSLLPFPSSLSRPASSTCLLAHVPQTFPGWRVLPCCQHTGVSRCRFQSPGSRIWSPVLGQSPCMPVRCGREVGSLALHGGGGSGGWGGLEAHREMTGVRSLARSPVPYPRIAQASDRDF